MDAIVGIFDAERAKLRAEAVARGCKIRSAAHTGQRRRAIAARRAHRRMDRARRRRERR